MKDEDRDSVKSESAVGTSKEPHEKEDALTVEGDPDCVTWKQRDFQVK